MADEIKDTVTDGNADISLDDLGAELGVSNEAEAVTLDEDEVVLAEDLEGFAKGFPAWDLLPPQK